jgi:hypothetical protein
MRISKRQARKEALSKGYRSNFEYDIAKYLTALKVDFEYEKERIKYVVPETTKTYTPDWLINGVLYESKGRFTAVDRKKMLLIRNSNPDLPIRMIFQNSQVRLSKISKTTYAEWCEKNHIEWADWRDKRKIERWFK